MINIGIIFLYSLLLSLPIFSNSLPHFIFDGIESSHECYEEKDHISFTIYGSITDQIDKSKIEIEDYTIENIGTLKCLFSENEKIINEKRKYKITCSIIGTFSNYGYIIEEPKVYGFDFNNERGESSWPKVEEKKMILIGECGSKIELEKESLILSPEAKNYTNPLNKVRKPIVNTALISLPNRKTVNELKISLAMKSAKQKYSLNEVECAY